MLKGVPRVDDMLGSLETSSFAARIPNAP